MKTLLVLGIAAMAVYLFLQRDAARRDELPNPEQAEIPARPVSGSSAPRVRCYRDQLVPIAGRIVAIEQGAITIDCPAPALPIPPNFTGPMWTVGATGGAGDSRALAKIAARQEEKYKAAVAEAGKKVSGVVVLRGHPQQAALRVGMPVSVTAAPLGGRSYTMAYEIAPDPPGAWMRKDRGNPLERR